MAENKKSKKIIITLFAIFGVLIFVLLISKIPLQNDTLFDIKLGEKYLTEGINTNDDFSIHENLKYVSHHFLVNIITFLVYNTFGFVGLYLLEILLTLVIAFLFFTANKIFLKNTKLAYFAIFIEMLFMLPFISVRAQMYSYILFLVEIICIEKFLSTKKFRYLALLSVLPLFIINFHAGTIFFYFIIIGVYLLGYIKVNTQKLVNDEERKKNLKYLFIPIIVGSILMFINPFGIDSVLYSIKTLGNSFITENISEFQSANIANALIAYIYMFIWINVYIFTNKKIKTYQMFFLYGTMFMTLISIRHFSLMVIVSVTNVEHLISVIKTMYNKYICGIKKEKINTINVIMCSTYMVVMFVTGAFFGEPDSYEFLPEEEYPLKGMEYINSNIPENSRIFNEYTWGSLMMLNNRKVFIDSRADLYTNEYNKGTNVAIDYIDAIQCKKDFNKIFEKYSIDYLFISTDSNLYYNVENNPNYETLYKDKNCAVIKVNI